MLKDIIGYEVDDAIKILEDNNYIIILKEYTTPRRDIMGNRKRVVKVTEKDNNVIIIFSYF